MNQGKAGVFNWGLLATTLAVGSVGIVNLYSACRGAEVNLVGYQVLWLGFGVGLALVLNVMDYRIFDQMAYWILVVVLFLLLSVLLFGRVVNGAQRWIQLGVINIQPSELAKIAIVMAVAKYFSDESSWPENGYTILELVKPASFLYPTGAVGALILFWERIEIGQWRFVLLAICLVWAAASFIRALQIGRTTLHDLLSPVMLVLLPAILVLRQPDLGTALVLFAIAGTMILFVKVRRFSVVMVMAVLSVMTVFLLVAASSQSLEILEPHQKKRIMAFFYPESASRDDRFQAHQSEITVGSGGTWGKGWGASTQIQFKFLPEQRTDFVFPVWAEEWGFAGGLFSLTLFWLWLALSVNAASSAREKFGALVGVGCVAMIFWHIVINIGMVVGLLPVVGMTLPLWSYGGSSVIVTMTAVGFLMSISSRRHAI